MNKNNNSQTNFDMYPKDVGILAFEVYYPAQYVNQEKLEEFDNVGKGKYTIGLGQSKMGFCFDYEDINSICLTALNNLIDKYNIDLREIGRLEVGTETLIDKSKSVKSVLMQLFDKHKNNDIEGVDNVNACFGGTAALFNAINWIESSYWDGRYAAVVMGDIAIYAKGNARPTGGAGAIALLIGPNAPLVFERGLRALHITHAYDFYKPVLDSEYPLVDGKLSIKCYLNALDNCYNLYKQKYHQKQNNSCLINGKTQVNGLVNGEIHKNDDHFDLNKATSFVFHSPYCKLVQKSFARLLWNDFLDDSSTSLSDDIKGSLEKFRALTTEDTYSDKSLETELVRLSSDFYKMKTQASLLFSNLIGNMYTPSLYGSLASQLVSKPENELYNSRIVLFSYGSGVASSMFSLIVNQPSTTSNASNSNDSRFSLTKIVKNLNDQKTNLNTRVEIEPTLYDKYLQIREKTNKKVPREPLVIPEALYPGTWYLTSVDDQYRRKYARKPLTETFNNEQAANSLNKFLSAASQQ